MGVVIKGVGKREWPVDNPFPCTKDCKVRPHFTNTPAEDCNFLTILIFFCLFMRKYDLLYLEKATAYIQETVSTFHDLRTVDV